MTKYIFRRQIDGRFKIQNDVKGSVHQEHKCLHIFRFSITRFNSTFSLFNWIFLSEVSNWRLIHPRPTLANTAHWVLIDVRLLQLLSRIN